MRRLFNVWAMGAIALLTPAWALGSDTELAQQIAGNLKNSGRLKGYSISVKVQGNVVQLDGTVRSDEQLEQALLLAEATPGIERVVNNLSVKTAKPARETGTTLELRTEPSAAPQYSHRRGPDEVVALVHGADGPVELARVDGRYLSTEVAGGFTGRMVGLSCARGELVVEGFAYAGTR